MQATAEYTATQIAEQQNHTFSASQINGGNSNYGRVGSDYYPTPPEVTTALLRFLKMPIDTTVWEPACGDGHMADVIAHCGYKVISSDIRNTGYGTPDINFLTTDRIDCDWIITNPPFSEAEAFIRRCNDYGKPFALLLKSQYWHAAKRLKLFIEIPPSEILPLTWRPDFLFKTRGRGAPLMDCIWCVWNGRKDTKYILLEKPNLSEKGELDPNEHDS